MANRGKVLYDFNPQAENQINVRVGQIINIVHYGGKGGWSKGVELNSGEDFTCFCKVLNNLYFL